MRDTLIYDRTASNVSTLKKLSKIRYQDMTDQQKQEWTDNLKGCYLYTDLNRVEEAVAHIAEKLAFHGFNISLQPTKTWTVDDIPTNSDMVRYISNIQTIRVVNIFPNSTPQAPTSTKIGWQEANNIEKILYDVDTILENIKQAYRYSGEIISGGDGQ